MSRTVRDRVTEALGVPVVSLGPLSGGCVGEVYRAALEDGRSLVVKVDQSPGGSLQIEGFMLSYLAQRSRLPVPRVLHAERSLLVMEFIEANGRYDADAQTHAAELLADLHGIGPESGERRFGLDRDTLIGSLHQPNPWTDSWIEFFREHRLISMADEAARAGRLPPLVRKRIDALARRLDGLLDEPDHSSLIHGDIWSGNVLCGRDDGGRSRIAALIDPAVYHADPEIELAFITLFSTFGEPFFRRYNELRPIRPGFFESRRHVYNLFPLLVHVRLFGGGYVAQVDATLRSLGF